MNRLFRKTMFVAVSLILISNIIHAEVSGWTTDYKAAFTRAKQEHKFVMIDFSGVQWCLPCKHLENEVFESKRFQEYAEKKFILINVDFPDPASGPKTGAELVVKYLAGEILLPTVVIVSPEGKDLGHVGYRPGGPDVFIGEVERVLKN